MDSLIDASARALVVDGALDALKRVGQGDGAACSLRFQGSRSALGLTESGRERVENRVLRSLHQCR
jgi:hypothetical protein